MNINKIIEKSISFRFIVLVITVMITFFGIQQIKKTPVDAIPDLSDIQVIVKTNYIGQSPKIIEEQITYPLSISMLSVPGAKTVRGYSFFGDSYVYVIFDEKTDIYWARSRVLEYLAQTSDKLPKGVTSSLGPDASGVGWVYEYALVDKTGLHDIAQLTSLQNWYLKTELQSVSGVSEVATVGGMEITYQVVLNPLKMLKYKLDISSIKGLIKSTNSEVGGSVVEMAEAEYMVRSRGYLKNIDDFRKIPLGIVNEDGISIVLEDVATIRKGPSSRRAVAELNGEGEVVGGIIVMRHGENALQTIEKVKSKLKELKKGLPKGVEIITTYDRSGLINSSVKNLSFKLFEEILIVGIICLIFLFHARSALVAIIILPITVLAAFIIMNILGVSANIMSLGGIAIAIGAVVDGAIVMIENVHKHLENFEKTNRRLPTDKEHWDIISTSSKEVGSAIFFSLLIITLSFIPVFALEAQEGKLFSPLALTKTIIMGATAILSITLIPVLMGYLIKGKILEEEKNPMNNMLIKIYKPALTLVLRFPKITILISVLLLLSIYYPLTKIGTEFMPELEEGDLLYMPTTFPGISVSKAGQLLQQTDRLIKTIPEVKSVFGKVGRAETATDIAPVTMIETTIQLKPKDEWREGYTIKDIINDLQQKVKMPGITNAWVQPIKTRIDMLSTGVKTQIGIKITGSNENELKNIGINIEKALKKMDETKTIYAERASDGRYIDIKPISDKYSRYGMTLMDVQNIVKYAIGGSNIGEVIKNNERYPINLRYPRKYRDHIENIKNLPITTPLGTYLKLSDIADIKVVDGAAMLKSENGRLVSWVFIETKDISIGEYTEKAKKTLDKEVKLPIMYNYQFAGQYEYMLRVEKKLKQVVPFTLAIIFIILMIIFGSGVQASMVMICLPFAVVGSVWVLFFLNFNFSVAVAVGMIALAGVSAEFYVLMLVYLDKAIKDRIDSNRYETIDDLKSAIMEGAVMRIRPKIMTVLTIFCGLLPIMWGDGSGSDVMQRIAAPMIGGMFTAPFISLFILPTLYLMVYKKDVNKENK